MTVKMLKREFIFKNIEIIKLVIHKNILFKLIESIREGFKGPKPKFKHKLLSHKHLHW